MVAPGRGYGRVMLKRIGTLLAGGGVTVASLVGCHTSDPDQLCIDTALHDIKLFPEHAVDNLQDGYFVVGTNGEWVDCIINHRAINSSTGQVYDTGQNHNASVYWSNHDVFWH